MESFEYQAGTKVLFGKGQIEHLPEEIGKFGRKVLLCYGGGSIKRNGIYQQIYDRLKDCEIYELAGIAPNPRITSVKEGIALCREHGIDVVLAVGGGSVIDCAKVVAAGVYYDGDPWKMVSENIQTENALPLVSVLTLAATGSEYDDGAVITNLDTNEKLGYGNPLTMPKVSILDPTYTYTVPAKQTAAGSIDIMSHLLEQYFGPDNTYLADQMLAGAIKTVIRYAPVAVKEPDNAQARGELMWISSLACNGILSQGCAYGGWCCHAIEHELSAFYDVTHGVGLAIITPRWMRHILNEKSVGRFAQYGRDVWGITGLDDQETAEKAIDETEKFFASLGVPMTLRELGIGEEHIDEMAEHAGRGRLANAYVPLLKKDVKAILHDCL